MQTLFDKALSFRETKNSAETQNESVLLGSLGLGDHFETPDSKEFQVHSCSTHSSLPINWKFDLKKGEDSEVGDFVWSASVQQDTSSESLDMDNDVLDFEFDLSTPSVKAGSLADMVDTDVPDLHFDFEGDFPVQGHSGIRMEDHGTLLNEPEWRLLVLEPVVRIGKASSAIGSARHYGRTASDAVGTARCK